MKTARPCSIDGCNRPYYGKGWCNLHYSRARRGVPVESPAQGAGSGRRVYTVEDINWDVLPHDAARAALARYLTGEDRQAIAAEFGVAEGTVMAWLARSRRSPKRSDAKPLPRDELAKLVAENWPLENMGVHFDCSPAHIRNEITRLGLSPLMACRLADWRAEQTRQADATADLRRRRSEDRRAWYAKRDAQIVEGYLSGDTLAVLADRFQIDPSLVWRVLKRHGVDTTQRKYAPRGWTPLHQAWRPLAERRLRSLPDLVEFA